MASHALGGQRAGHDPQITNGVQRGIQTEGASPRAAWTDVDARPRARLTQYAIFTENDGEVGRPLVNSIQLWKPRVERRENLAWALRSARRPSKTIGRSPAVIPGNQSL